jgi:FkbM family methyltransferase
MNRWFKKVASMLPRGIQLELRRLYFHYQIAHGTFIPDEAEIRLLKEWLKPGDWSIDVGANIGYYTLEMARCVGTSGRVFAIEPMPETFDLLAGNIRTSDTRNVTLMNIAASSSAAIASMDLPTFEDSGVENFYQARLSDGGSYPVLCLPLDGIPFAQRVKLIKVDAEGHDLDVLKGAETLIARDGPVLIVEAAIDSEIAAWLRHHGYTVTAATGSSNVIAIPEVPGEPG